MTNRLKEVLERATSWPESDQEELVEIARNIEARRSGVYDATPEELAAIDEALGQLARGEVATASEVEAAFSKFRSA
jgi:hypothetical protein